MGDPRTVPAVCSAEETAFQCLHTGSSADLAVDSQSSSKLAAAWRAANPAFSMAVDPDDFPEPHMEARGGLPCCCGVDQPGIGLVHTANCPNRAVAERVVGDLLDSPVSRGSEYRAGEVLPTLYEALKNIAALPIVATNDSKPSEKEKAPEGETAGADDGIRARGLAERVCLKCGSRAGVWIAEVKPESEVWLHDLALNQCVMAATGVGHVLYTHQCASLAHRGINALFDCGGLVDDKGGAA